MIARSTETAKPDWAGLIAEFHRAATEGELDQFRHRRWERADEYRAWLTEDALPSLTAQQAETLYRGAGGRKIARFRTNTIAEIRDVADFLLYDAIKLENRFEECAVETGGFGLAGAGKEWPSYLLALRDPGLFAPWSPHTERALRGLGMLPPGLRNGHPGLCYIDLLDALGHIAARTGLADFRAVDEFCYFNGRVRRGSS